MARKKGHGSLAQFNAERMYLSATQPIETVYNYFETAKNGLDEEEVERRHDKFGKNIVVHEKKQSPVVLFAKAFINPFIGVLTILMAISFLMDVLIAVPEDRDWSTIIIIGTLILVSAVLRFVQDWRADRASDALKKMVRNTCLVRRAGQPDTEIDIEDLVPGDIVLIAAGDMIPADMRIVHSKDLFVSQSTLTGESDAIEKTPTAKIHDSRGSVVELDNIAYMGSTVISGAAIGIVVAIGNDTYLGTIAKSIAGHRAATAFDKGITKVSLLLIRYMLIMVPIVFVLNGISKGDWLEAFLFGISVAVGLTPEMLPMIVTANLSKGAVAMAKKKTIVKDQNAIQNFGAMNILCTDKTGTITLDNIVLEKHICADGTDDKSNRVLRHAYFNSYFQTGLKNVMDRAIISHVKELDLEQLSDSYTKVDEIPFDFSRRRMSVVVEDLKGKRQIITKGAVEEMLSICSFADMDGAVVPLTEEVKERAVKIVDDLNNDGMRVLAVAKKSFLDKDNNFDVDDEFDMVLIGYLAFLDPPKESAGLAISQLHGYGVDVKILSGDNDAVVRTIARQVGIDVSGQVTGLDFAAMSDEEKANAVAVGNIFSKLTPIQKVEIITMLQAQGNTVGFLGDGINDAAALRQSDIGISVDSGVDIAKESADIILLEKDLMVLEKGVIEGRKTFGNIIKYVKMAASSNFGNVFSVLASSAFLPFLPMMPVQLLTQNLLYDCSQIAIPFDQVDEEYLRKPRIWDASDISRFMLWVGPISCIFDFTTFILLWWFFKAQGPETAALFHSGWFVEGLLSQTLIIHMIRTRKVPFFQSIASRPLIMTTIVIMSIGIAIPFTPLGAYIGLVHLPWTYFPWLFATLLCYCLLTQFIKGAYIKAFRRWL
ncbi:MAG: magnesium-translocating P-type ATPase [Bacteroidales bacterium]|nr:magnesium-translocating P-type ATPase [Bacteroidales bacterium]